MLYFKLNGPFAITDQDGVDRRPKLLKARAILAVLAATPGHRHSRAWFQSLLWEDRQHTQALCSLRSALADIRRQLGPWSAALVTDHSDVALDPDMFDHDLQAGNDPANAFLEGFDVPHSGAFEDWLRETRMAQEAMEQRTGVPAQALQPKDANAVPEEVCQILLAASAQGGCDVTRMQCDALVDSMAKSIEDLGIAEVFDGRGRGDSLDDFLRIASDARCTMVLISETAETPHGAIARLKIVEAASARLIWSKSITGASALDLDDPGVIGVVAEFVDVLSERLLRPFQWQDQDIPAPLLAVAGMHRIFRLGAQNFEAADQMLKRAHEQMPRGSHLAWRAYLRTLLVGELEFTNKEAVIEEGSVLARRALENEPHNSMVLALCAHVENMLHNAYDHAFDLSARSLELNRCNPLAWASLGVAAAFLGEEAKGAKLAATGAKLGARSRYGFITDSLASSASLVAGDMKSARGFAEAGHSKSTSFAPPLRFLSALYCLDGQLEKAHIAASKLRAREPDFNLSQLRDDGYPTDTLRRARILDSLPTSEL